MLGGLGLAAYSSANHFLDAFARRQNQLETAPWISINWDTWQFPGDDLEGSGNSEVILPHEGQKSFARILDRSPGQIVVALNLDSRFASWIHLEALREPPEAEQRTARTLHPRPELSSQYEAPRNSTEEKIVETWEELLGVTPIGVHDKFFELGGHSLLAIQVVSRLRGFFKVEIPAQRLFLAPTVAK